MQYPGFAWTTGVTGFATGGRYDDMVWSPEAGCFVGIFSSGSANHVIRSVDGITWTQPTLPTGTAWRGVVWSAPLGLFCAVGGDFVATSPDGITWTSQSFGAETFGAAAITWAGGSVQKFVTSGVFPPRESLIYPLAFTRASFGTTTPRTVVHPDPSGTNTVIFVGVICATDTITGVTHDGNALTFIDKLQVPGGNWISLWWRAHGLFGNHNVVVSSSPSGVPTEVYISSYEGCDQTTQPGNKTLVTATSAVMATTLTPPRDDCYRVMFGATAGGNVTAGSGTSIRQFNGGAGGVWADSDKSFYPAVSATLTANITAGSSAWAAIGFTLSNAISRRFMTSPDGITWTAVSQLFTHEFSTLCWAEELGLLVGGVRGMSAFHLFSGVDDRTIVTSSDAVTWTTRTFPQDLVSFDGIGHSRLTWATELGLFVAVTMDGLVGVVRIVTSPDGINWTVRTDSDDPDKAEWVGVVWVNRPTGTKFLLAFGRDDEDTSKPIMYSEDGITWTVAPSLGFDYPAPPGRGDWFVAAYSPELDTISLLAKFDERWLTATFMGEFQFDPDIRTSIGLIWVEAFLQD